MYILDGTELSRPASVGGTDGGHAGSYSKAPGIGQNTTTREFGEPTGTLYAGGGGGSGTAYSGQNSAAGGDSTAGSGSACTGESAPANYGGGGGGGDPNAANGCAYAVGGSGGSGIVIIRNTRTIIEPENEAIPKFIYTGDCEVIDDGNGNWKIKFLTSGTLTLISLGTAENGIDAFLVGGGGGGGIGNTTVYGGGGGGGGYTTTIKGINLSINTPYSIIVGLGGTSQSNGGQTFAFDVTVNGGSAGSTYSGGSGGSGGGSGAYYRSSGSLNSSKGGTDGANGAYGISSGVGQGTTTREFGEEEGTLYSAGGGGSEAAYFNFGNSAAGDSSGGSGGGCTGEDAPANFGGGGGGADRRHDGCGLLLGGYGGSGIVIIRNAR